MFIKGGLLSLVLNFGVWYKMRPGFDGVFTSESVTEGHPDKLCDKISDAILDEVLTTDPNGRVACESLVKVKDGVGHVVLAGEITAAGVSAGDIYLAVRDAIKDVGYDEARHPGVSFLYNTVEITDLLSAQSSDISQGVTAGRGLHKEQGAGDQGLMFGYACNETEELIPTPIAMAHDLAQHLTDLRKTGILPWLRPDGKSQVTIGYKDGEPRSVDAVVVSAHHSDDVDRDTIVERLTDQLVVPVCEGYDLGMPEKIHINPTGRFVEGGPVADAGLTGRKIIVDTYGGMGRHGGGAFSGKDASKVDRSAAYAARQAALSVVNAGMADRCEVQLAYAIGVAEPVGVNVNTFGTSSGYTDERIARILEGKFDFRPGAIIERLDLKKPGFSETAAYGHFGRSGERFTWERPVDL